VVNQEKGPDILTLVEAGQLARMGMNSAGLGICNNYIECEADGMNMGKGIPTTLIRRRALNHETYREIVGTITHTPRSFSGTYLVATAEGEGDATDIEATPETVYYLFPKDGLIVHSYIIGAGPDMWNDPPGRKTAFTGTAGWRLFTKRNMEDQPRGDHAVAEGSLRAPLFRVPARG
jgi:hypothetical protein